MIYLSPIIMSGSETNVAHSVLSQTKMEELAKFINEHVLETGAAQHATNAWNIPFFHVPGLNIFRREGVMLIFSFVLLLALGRLAIFLQSRRRLPIRPHGMYNLLEFGVSFVRDQIAIPAMGRELGSKMTPQMCSVFFMILTMNLCGACPLFDTATANINITTALALLTLCWILWASVSGKGVKGFMSLFFVPSLPMGIRLALAPIEIMSFFCRILALTVRLFANMLAGHIILFTLLGMVWLFGAIALPAVVLATGFQLYEIFIALLQAFIFTLLSATFIGLAMHPEH